MSPSLRSLIALVALAACVCRTTTIHGQRSRSSPAEQPIAMLSGDSLDRWLVENANDGVNNANGVLTIRDRAGWVRTRTGFGSFVLTFEARAVMPGARAAVAILGRWPADLDVGSAHVLPIVGNVVPEFPLGSVHLNALPVNPNGVGHALLPVGEWQRYRIERRYDGGVVASVNGSLILTTGVARPASGWIGYRAHGGAIELRNVTVVPGVDSSGPADFYRPEDGVTLPRVLHEERPQYTSAAMKARIEGSVLVECVVDKDGRVAHTTIVRSLDPQYGLDDQAVDAARQWRFEPGTKSGQPVAVLVYMELTFTLRK